MENNQNLESTSYDVNAISNYDYRFEAAKKDAIFLHSLGLLFTLVATIWIYAFGSCEPSQQTYFLGFPLWFSGATIIYGVMFVIGMTYIWKWETFPLTARNGNKGAEK